MSPQGLSPDRRAFLQSAAAAAGVFIATGAYGQAGWPDHPVRIIIPYPAARPTCCRVSSASG
jgi:hypothetical protein